MIKQVESTKDGYVVSVLITESNGHESWKPLRNFGDRQSDAIEFRDHDVDNLPDSHIKTLIQRYDKSVKYHRITKYGHHPVFKIERSDE